MFLGAQAMLRMPLRESTTLLRIVSSGVLH